VSSAGEWQLEPDAEREILLPWLEREPNPDVRARVYGWLGGLLREPFRPQLEDDDTGVFSLEAVPGTDVGLMWVLDVEGKQVILAYVG
jgi:hypothetical protein